MKKKTAKKAKSNCKKCGNKSDADPLGAYTGVPIDGNIPTQDADDL